jgi:hypothetical protein
MYTQRRIRPSLDALGKRLADSPLNPLVQNASAIGSLADVPEVLGGLQSDRDSVARITTAIQLQRIRIECRWRAQRASGFRPKALSAAIALLCRELIGAMCEARIGDLAYCAPAGTEQGSARRLHRTQ